MNQTQNRVDFLDTIRGVAILGVFLFHLVLPVCGVNRLEWGAWFSKPEAPFWFWVLSPFSLTWCGVPIFFVVSGFCIHLSYRRKPDWFDFACRRFFRIYPAYVVALLICALLLPWTRIEFSLAGAAQLASHFALVQNLDNRTYYEINVVFWSIAVEVQLYLLYPLLLGLVSRLGWKRALTCLAVLEISLRGVASIFLIRTGDIPHWFIGLPFIYWFSWAIGAVMADAYLDSRPMPFVNQSALLWCGAAVFCYHFKPLQSFTFLLFALMTAVIIAKLLCQQSLHIRLPAFLSRHLHLVGIRSYSIYLLHAPLMYGACAPVLSLKVAAKLHLYDALPHPLIILCGELALWPLVVVISGLSYRYIELPGIAFGKKFVLSAGRNKAVAT